MSDLDWLERLEGLVVRFSCLGISTDMGAMRLCELWALYCFLGRLDGEA